MSGCFLLSPGDYDPVVRIVRCAQIAREADKVWAGMVRCSRMRHGLPVPEVVVSKVPVVGIFVKRSAWRVD